MSNIKVTSEVLENDDDICVVCIWGGERCYARLNTDGAVQVWDSIGSVFTRLHPLTAHQKSRVRHLLKNYERV